MDTTVDLQQKLIIAEGTIRAYESEIESLRKGLLASSLDGVIITDPHKPDNPITYVNHVFVEMTGFESQEIVGKNMHILEGKETENESLAKLYEAMQERKEFRIVLKNYKKDGTLFWNEITLIPSFDNKGDLVSYIATMHDVTKEKEIDRMKTEFISIASHQLRTPLTAMKWYMEMLLNGEAGELNPNQKEYIGYVNQSNERMIELVNSLLNISRIESGRLMVVPELTDLRKIVDAILLELYPDLEKKHLKLEKFADTDLPMINVDPKLIHQVYQNLLTNAIKYTNENGTIVIDLHKEGDQIKSSVKDTGLGIPKKDHDRVFQRFFRSDNIVRVVTEGNGLGLYLVKAIIDASGGKIDFESEEGNGTMFWFTIPLAGSQAKSGEVSLT